MQRVSLFVMVRCGCSEILAQCEYAQRLPWGDLKGSLRETTERRARRRGMEKLEKEGGSVGKQLGELHCSNVP